MGTVAEQLRTDLLSVKHLVHVAKHPHGEWMGLQLQLHQERLALESSLARIAGAGTSLVPLAALQSFARVWKAVYDLMKKAQKLETAAAIKHEENESEEGKVKATAANMIWNASATEQYRQILTAERSFLKGRCEYYVEELSRVTNLLGDLCKGMQHGGTDHWVQKLPKDPNIKDVLATWAPLMAIFDGQEINETFETVKKA